MSSPELQFIGELMKVGVSTGICAYGWWNAEKHRKEAQALADSRAEVMAKLMVDQVTTNEKTTSAMALQNVVLDRVSATLDRVEPVVAAIRKRMGIE